MASSNTYNFGTLTTFDDLARDAFERIGIIGNTVTGLQLQSALLAANLELTDWQGKGLNLPFIAQDMITINANQPTYSLPVNTVRLLEVSVASLNRLNTGGTAFSSAGGNASNVFTTGNTAGCIQTTPDGYISYDYGDGNTNSVLYIGVQTLIDQTLSLSIDYSFDGVNWYNVYSAPDQLYQSHFINWFVLPTSLNAQIWRVKEVGGAIMQIQQLYFDNASPNSAGNRLLTPISRSEYMAIANRSVQSSPGSYYFNNIDNPTITLWPMPYNNEYTVIYYTRLRYAQDVSALTQTVDIPQRFFEAFVAGLAVRLAEKFPENMTPERWAQLGQRAPILPAYGTAAQTDFENVTIRFQPDFNAYGG